MWYLEGFNFMPRQVYVGAMMCIPRAADTARTVLKTMPVNASNDWWTGLVRDRDHETGETRLRLERWADNGGSYTNPHTWRVRPDFWEQERAAVATFKQQGGRAPPANLPIDDHLTPLECMRIRKDDVRWVAIVRIDRPYRSECVRLYHWDSVDGSTRQKWTVGRYWSKVEDLATQHLRAVA